MSGHYQIPMKHGFVVLTAVVDAASRRARAHKVATTLEGSHASEIMSEALGKYGKPAIVNKNQSSQFADTDCTCVVLHTGCKVCINGRIAWRNYVFVERLWRTVKCKHF